MEFRDERLCDSCADMNLASVFDPDNFDSLPTLTIDRLGGIDSFDSVYRRLLEGNVADPMPEWIRHVGHWSPPTLLPSDSSPECPFCSLLAAMATYGYPHWINRPRELIALKPQLLYEHPETTPIEATASCTPTSLLVVNKTFLDSFLAWERDRMEKIWRLCQGRFSTISIIPPAVAELPRLPPTSVSPQLLQYNSIDFDLLRSWLATCVGQHGNRCAPPNEPPVPRLKLIDCRARHIINARMLPGKKYEYVALSYVWGTGDPEPYVYPSLLESLPLVVLDAMTLVLRLGFQYLWVDRYCIWQDDQAHKMSQVNKMDQIYSGASFTIFACAGEDPSYGLPGISARQRCTFQLVETIGNVKLVTDIGGHHEQERAVSLSKWKSRGWTFQEEALSCRKLYITDYQASFICSEMTCFEHLTAPLSFRSNQGDFSRPSWSDVYRPHGIWPLIIQYSHRQLKYQDDRINAILGAMNRWARIHPNCFHYWGVPIVGAPPCWQSPHLSSLSNKLTRAFLAGLHVLPGFHPRQANTRNRLFPSWSWAGHGQDIQFQSIYGSYEEGLANKTYRFDAEVWVERPDGMIVGLEKFISEGGCQLPQWTPYLHIECWVFKIGPFQLCKLKDDAAAALNLEDYSATKPKFCIPASGNYQDRPRRVREFEPDSFHDASSALLTSEFEAISFTPLEPVAATFALVLDIFDGVRERIGLLRFYVHEVADENKKQAVEPDVGEVGDVYPQAQRRRIRLG
jgi:hypothetical protein